MQGNFPPQNNFHPQRSSVHLLSFMEPTKMASVSEYARTSTKSSGMKRNIGFYLFFPGIVACTSSFTYNLSQEDFGFSSWHFGFLGGDLAKAMDAPSPRVWWTLTQNSLPHHLDMLSKGLCLCINYQDTWIIDHDFYYQKNQKKNKTGNGFHIRYSRKTFGIDQCRLDIPDSITILTFKYSNV